MNGTFLRAAETFCSTLRALILISAAAFALEGRYAASQEPTQSDVDGSECPKAPSILWSTQSATIVVAPSETSTIALRFKTGHRVEDARVNVKSAIAAWIHPEPAFLGTIHKNETWQVILTIRPSLSAKLGTYFASVYIQKADDDERSRCKSSNVSFPFRLTINIWSQTVEPTSGLQFKLPPFGQKTEVTADTSTPGQTVLNLEVQSGPQKTYTSQFGIVIYANPQHLL
jgi:hypothetical protein